MMLGLGASWKLGGREEHLVKESCSLAMRASAHHSVPFLLQDESIAIFAFTGLWSADEWRDDPLIIDADLFPSLRCLGSDQSAIVHGAFLHRFRALLRCSEFERQVRGALCKGKKIVFTGHSAAGAIATLATLWLLEQFRKSEHDNKNLPLCLTFGSPLVGDGVFDHALCRENWSCYLINFVNRYDIVPRISLSPYKSIEQEFRSLLFLLNPSSQHPTHDLSQKSAQAVSFFTAVMRNACTAASLRACVDMGCTNRMLEELPGFVQLCPYRPAGQYIFLTGNGRAVSVNNSDSVLQLLFFSLQLGPGEELEEITFKSLKEHLAYGAEVQRCIEMQDVVLLDRLDEIPLSSENGFSSGLQSIDRALQDLGLSMEAKLCLRAAGEVKQQQLRNKAKIQANYIKIQEALKSLRQYRTVCELRQLGYYDAFKLQREHEDFNANLKRLELAGLWDEIIEMLKRFELPDNFECQMDWVNLGTNYRRLVEPLDIANFYRHSKNEDTGPYLLKGRPKRYKYTQRWLEHALRMPPWSSSDSCFWAMVEELRISSAVGTPFEEMRGKVVELEKAVHGWCAQGEMGKDVFLESSTFMKWWKALPQQHRASSCIAKLVDG